MKLIVLSLCGLVLACAASAQISLGVNGNYTMYKGDFGRSTPGFSVRAAYEQDKYAPRCISPTGLPYRTRAA